MKGRALGQKDFAMNGAGSVAMTPEIFHQREQRRRSLFSHAWEEMIPKVFEDVPKYYRLANIVASFGLWELWVWQFVRTIKLEPGYKVLDVCAGTNDIGIRLLRKQPDISVTAIDRSKEMQEQGQRRARKYGVRIESVIHDVHELPFPDHSFDVVTLQAASRHLLLDKVLPEILRVLKPGGDFYHCDMLKPSNRSSNGFICASCAFRWPGPRGFRIDGSNPGLRHLFQGCDLEFLYAGRAVRGVSPGRLYQRDLRKEHLGRHGRLSPIAIVSAGLPSRSCEAAKAGGR